MAESKVFKVWLCNTIDYYPVESREFFSGWGSAAQLGAVQAALRGLLDEVCKHPASGFDKCDIAYTAPGHVPEPPDVMIRICRRGKSRIAGLGGTLKHGDAGGGATMWTSNGALSEVYPEAADGDASYTRLVAKLCFHELMHNKLDVGPGAPLGDLHAGATGLDKWKIESATQLTPACIRRLAPYLKRKVRQHGA